MEQEAKESLFEPHIGKKHLKFNATDGLIGMLEFLLVNTGRCFNKEKYKKETANGNLYTHSFFIDQDCFMDPKSQNYIESSMDRKDFYQIRAGLLLDAYLKDL